MAARQPTKLTFEEVAALPLQGSRFRTRQATTHTRGTVRRVHVEDEILVVDVCEVQSRTGDAAAWQSVPDCDYRGRRGLTSVFQNVDGGVSIDIPYIGALTILPEGRS